MGTRWPWRPVVVDGLLTLIVGTAIVVFGMGFSPAEQTPPPARGLDAGAYVLMALAAATIPTRRWRPVAALVASVVLVVGYLAAGYPYSPVFLPMSLAMYTLATRTAAVRSLIAAGAALVAMLLPEVMRLSVSDLAAEVVPLVGSYGGLLLLPWAAGTAVRSRSEHLAVTRREALRRHTGEERLRIAREVHDIVAHGLAVINMQAGVGRRLLAEHPDRAERVLDTIKQVSKEALDQLRTTLAVLRTAPGDTAAPPGLERLDALRAAMASGGLPVEVVRSGEPAPLPAAVDLAAYRIVQESLTNALRHAEPTQVTVRVDYQPAAVRIDVVDNGRGMRTGVHRPRGHGVAGMRERAAEVGGTLEAKSGLNGGFHVTAELPVDRHRS
jgi:signal transduction histidine kinase